MMMMMMMMVKTTTAMMTDVAQRRAWRRFRVSQLLLVIALTAGLYLEETILSSGLATMLAADAASHSPSSSSSASSSSSLEPSSLRSSLELQEDSYVRDTPRNQWILQDDNPWAKEGDDNPWAKEGDDHHQHHHRHRRQLQDHGGYRHHPEQRLLEVQRPVEATGSDISSVLKFEILDENLLTLRGNLISNFAPDKTSALWWSDVWSLSLSPEDRSLFFLVNAQLWSVDRRRPTDRDGIGSVSRVAGPWRPPDNEGYSQAFAITMGGKMTSSNSVPMNRIALVDDSFNHSLRAYNVDDGSIPPPFSVLDYMHVTLNESPFLSLAWDSKRRILYGSTRSALYRMSLSLGDGGGKPTLERWIGPEL
ncbi:hypothetical protein CBR_g26235 [Chara braunii]|uniref:Uncharacterized protein n=1 Tax=Chara braunii TaxID=69332 RepID=A0A388L7I4_CHABU|nr:hypothetical protein CBR_g26235 [Chara braunii]|eukprot:GBG78202.1 hypothetical protein CBR_g26235 [Chara braunii]